jgi:hypothetical protein
MIGRKSVHFRTLSEKPGRVLRLIQFDDLLVPCSLTKDKIFAGLGRGQFFGPRFRRFKVWK